MGADIMAALRLTSATLCSSKQITKVFQSNLRVLSARGYKDSSESHNETFQQKTILSQPASFSGSFRREFRTSSVLGEAKVVVVPAFADSISEGDVRFDKAIGDAVNEDEEVCQIETDKTSIPVKAPFSGVITEFFVEDGATVQAGANLFSITPGGGAAAPAPAPTPIVVPTPVAAPAPAAAAPAMPATPPPRPSPPTAPAATISAASIQPKVAASLPTSQAVPLARIPPPDYSKEITGTRTEQRVKMNRMRLRIAQRLKEAQNTNAMLTTFNGVEENIRRPILESARNQTRIHVRFRQGVRLRSNFAAGRQRRHRRQRNRLPRLRRHFGGCCNPQGSGCASAAQFGEDELRRH